MDRWLLSSAHSLVQYVREEMAAYRLYTVVPRLVQFVTDLSNWYIRLNRARLKGSGGDDDDDDEAEGEAGDEADTLNACSALFHTLMISGEFSLLLLLLLLFLYSYIFTFLHPFLHSFHLAINI